VPDTSDFEWNFLPDHYLGIVLPALSIWKKKCSVANAANIGSLLEFYFVEKLCGHASNPTERTLGISSRE
jgi:hypothetical protein